VKTSGKPKAAEAINTYFISKVNSLRATALENPASESVNLAMDVIIPMVETVNLASNAAIGRAGSKFRGDPPPFRPKKSRSPPTFSASLT
jgi:hypothetical protein